MDKSTLESEPGTDRTFAEEQVGYQHSLKPRQIRMIGIAGAIGTGLFLGAGGRLAAAGPSLFIAYAVCGVLAYFVLRALGELVVYRPSSGSFISYAREFLGEKFAFVAGWMNFLYWSMVAIADVTAVALYIQFWKAFTSAPQWLLALIALVMILSINLISVKAFGELEFWFALIKVGALVLFLVIGVVFLAAAWPLNADGQTIQPGLGIWADHGGLFPSGVLPTVLVVQGVVFAYAGIELLGTTAGETADPKKVIPKAINSVIVRIAIFYVGTVLLLSLLLPRTVYKAGTSPFVTFFSSVGDGSAGIVAGSIMNFVVITAALSAMNAGLYSTGRSLRSMSINGAAPAFASRMSRQGVPYGGILITASVAFLGIVLNLVVPGMAFEIVLNMATLGILCSWGMVMLCQIQLQRWAKQGKATRPSFRLPGAPFTAYLTLAALAVVLVLIALDYPVGTWTVGTFAIVGVPLLVAGWFLARGRIRAAAAAEQGAFTGALEVSAAEQPVAEAP